MHPQSVPPVPLPDPTAAPPDPRDDVAPLVAAAADGDRAAFGTLYERYALYVHGILLAHADRDDVQDLLQDVFFRALRSLHTLRDPSAFGGWIGTLARNEARMRHRGRREHEPLDAKMAATPPADGPGALTQDDVLRALRALPERYREPL